MLKIGTSEQLDELVLAAGKPYSDARVYFWRVVRKKKVSGFHPFIIDMGIIS